MTQPRAISGTYADFKMIKTRSVVQIVIEVGLEKAEEALHLLGFPNPAKETWCAVALLNEKPKGLGDAATREDEGQPSAKLIGAKSLSPSPAKPLALSARAALLTKDPEFWEFMSRNIPGGGPAIGSEREADARLKAWCAINSKRDLDSETTHLSHILTFRGLAGNFRAWQQAKGHGVVQ